MSLSLIAKRLQAVKPSPTLMLTQRASELKAQGRDIINLCVGEPDFETPIWVCQAAIDAIHQGQTRYTNVTGTPALKKAVQMKFKQENQLDYSLNEVIVGVGAKQLIFNALMATLNQDDEVIIPAPYWVSYMDMVLIAEGQPIVIECPSFKITPDALKQAITPRTKWLLLNSPSNPTGAVYSYAELTALAEVLYDYPHVYILSDDIYEHILYQDEPFCTLAQVASALKGRVLTVNGVSKSYAMTGWRIGYAGGPVALISAMGMLQSQSTSNPCSIAQAAAVAALTGPQQFRHEQCTVFQQRRDYLVNALQQIPGLTCQMPQGAFYAYPICQGIIGMTTPTGQTLKTDSDFAAYLLDDAGIAVVPGEAFGLSPAIRLSYAIGQDQLTQAIERIDNAVARLNKT